LCKAAGRVASAGVFKSVSRDSVLSALKSVRLVAFVGLNLESSTFEFLLRLTTFVPLHCQWFLVKTV